MGAGYGSKGDVADEGVALPEEAAGDIEMTSGTRVVKL